MPVSVLVVEKDAMTRDTIAYMLDTLGYIAVPVEDEELASRVLESVFVDVMIISLRLGDPDGTGIASEAKRLQRHLNVIVVSGRNPPESLLPSIDAFVQKPFSMWTIDQAIKQVQTSARDDRARKRETDELYGPAHAALFDR